MSVFLDLEQGVKVDLNGFVARYSSEVERYFLFLVQGSAGRQILAGYGSKNPPAGAMAEPRGGQW